MPDQSAHEFGEIIRRTDRLLWDAYSASAAGVFPTSGPRVIFPRYRARAYLPADSTLR